MDNYMEYIILGLQIFNIICNIAALLQMVAGKVIIIILISYANCNCNEFN